MKIYNITTPRKYEKNGEEKTAWNKVGKLVKFDATQTKPEGFILELSMFPDTKFVLFEQKDDSYKKTSKPQATTQTVEEGHPDHIKPEDIPF